MTTHSPLRLLGIVGSLRRNAHSRAILLGMRSVLDARFNLSLVGIDLPLYNQDLDDNTPPSTVDDFRKQIAASDALIISTPEYNHGMPGVLKSALDWASRPHGHSVLKSKRFIVVSSSPAFTGGARAQVQVSETMLAAEALPVPGPQIVIGAVGGKVSDGVLIDGTSLGFIATAIESLLASHATDLLAREMVSIG
jgi:chromate reductase